MSRIRRVKKTQWNVVLTEDDDGYALVIERALKKATDVPVEIRRARTGIEALALLRDLVPDLLLLDLKMPGMAGHEVLAEMKGDDALSSIPVVVLTSSDSEDDVAKTYALGGNHFITKPNKPLELEAKLVRLLRNLRELGRIRRGSGASPTAVSAVDTESIVVRRRFRWVAVGGGLTRLIPLRKSLRRLLEVCP